MATITAFESPHLVQRTWDQQRAAPERLTELSSVRVRTRCALEVGTSDDPINGHEAQPAGAGSGELAVSARAEMTVGELKQRISHLLHITPRKALSLTWWGVTLDDDERRLDTYHVNQNGQLQLSLSAKTQAELAAAHALSQVRVRSDDVSVVVGQLSPETTVAQVKNALLSGKLLPGLDSKYAGLLDLQYSIVFRPNSIFGSPMDDRRSLGSYGVLHDDILNLRYDKPEADDAAVAAEDA